MPTEASYSVAIVVDPAYGPRLAQLAARIHVWAIDSAANRATADTIWRGSPEFSFESGITLFRSNGKGPIQDVADIVGTVETHHGESSHVPPVSVLDVYGAEAVLELRIVFARYGFTHFVDLDDGFRAMSRRAS